MPVFHMAGLEACARPLGRGSSLVLFVRTGCVGEEQEARGRDWKPGEKLVSGLRFSSQLYCWHHVSVKYFESNV